MRLSSASVFLDFDGTVTARDTGVHLLERLATGDWRGIDEQYVAGVIGSREALAREWALLPREEALLRSVAREVPIDPHFASFVDRVRAQGAEVLVVSDGFGFYAEEVCGHVGVEVLTNTVDFDAHELGFPHVDRCCPCSTCGTCKQSPIKEAKRRGRMTVFVGDGVSDRKAALLVDVLFAKDGLAAWCEDVNVPFTPFDTLADVAGHLLD